MISVQGLSLGWQENKRVLTGISYDFEVPGVYALMGKSGLGKTTFLHGMAGLLKPQSGTVSGFTDAKRAILFQEDRLLPWCSALKNVCLAMENEDRGKARGLLNSLGIDDVDQLPGSFSGGMQRRVAIARALALGAPYLLLDEPFSGLDLPLKELVAEKLKSSASFILLSTHDMEEARLINAKPLMLHPDKLMEI